MESTEQFLREYSFYGPIRLCGADIQRPLNITSDNTFKGKLKVKRKNWGREGMEVASRRRSAEKF